MATINMPDLPQSVNRIDAFIAETLRWLNHSGDEFAGAWSLVPATDEHLARKARVLRCDLPKWRSLIGFHFDNSAPGGNKILLRPAVQVIAGRTLTPQILGLDQITDMSCAPIPDMAARTARAAAARFAELFERQEHAKVIYDKLMSEDRMIKSVLGSFGLVREPDGSYSVPFPNARGKFSVSWGDIPQLAITYAAMAPGVNPTSGLVGLTLMANMQMPNVHAIADLLAVYAGESHGDA